MLFIVKQKWSWSLIALVVFVSLALSLRWCFGSGAPLEISLRSVAAGACVFAGIMISDALLHQLLEAVWKEGYRRRLRQLICLFQSQDNWSIAAGALLAGLGEELLFRGLTISPFLLTVSAIVFGLMHHVRSSLWPFTLWAVYEGLLLSLAVYLTGNLLVPMIAHFLHDLAGFIIFRHWNKTLV